MELIEKRGNSPRPWRIRYKDNWNDPITSIGSFASRAEAQQWLAKHPVLPAEDEDDKG